MKFMYWRHFRQSHEPGGTVVESVGHDGLLTRNTLTIHRVAPGPAVSRVAWLAAVADAIDSLMQRVATGLAGLLGWPAALVFMLPVVLLVRPPVAILRSAERSWTVRLLCLLIVFAAIFAGPSVGTRAGLLLLAVYVLGWVCAIKTFRAIERSRGARRRVAHASLALLEMLVSPRVHLSPDQRN